MSPAATHDVHRGALPFPRSLPEFQRLFPDDAACAAYLERCRWPELFRCPSCGKGGDPFRFAARPGVLRCRGCRRDTSLTAGTIMHRACCEVCSEADRRVLRRHHLAGGLAVLCANHAAIAGRRALELEQLRAECA